MVSVAAVLAATLAARVPHLRAAQKESSKEGEVEKKKGEQPEGEKAGPAEKEWPYLELTMDNQLRRFRNVTIKAMLRGNENMTSTFDDFFMKWFFPQFTQRKNLNNMAELRAEMNEYFERAGRNPAATTRLNNLTLEMMFALASGARVAVLRDGQKGTVIRLRSSEDGSSSYQTLTHQPIPTNLIKETRKASRDFHPAVKYNAMLLIANLNEQPQTTTKAAVPWQGAFKTLVLVATYPRAPQSLRVAALIGLARHAESTDKTTREIIASNMLKILKETSSPDRSPDGILWIQRQAVEILAKIGLPGPDGQVLRALGRIVADGDQPLALRAAAAQAMSKIKPETLAAKDANALTRGLSTFLLEACRYEINGGSSGDQQVSWPRLAVSLDGVNNALAVVEAFAGAEEKALSAGMKKSISSLSRNVGSADLSEQRRKKALQQETVSLARTMGEPESEDTDPTGEKDETGPTGAQPGTGTAKPQPIEPPADFPF